MHFRKRPVWFLYIVCVAAAIAAYLLVPHGTARDLLVLGAVAASAVAMIVLGSHRARLSDELNRCSRRDQTTGLANRPAFMEMLGEALSLERDPPPAILLLGVEDLRLVNESVGRAAGDDLLRAIADRLPRLLRQSDICAWTGENFAILVEDVAIESPVAVARRLVKASRLPFKLSSEYETTISVSAGVAFAGGEDGGETLLRNAEIALSRAREIGNGAVEVFEPGMHTEIFGRIVLRGQLERAIDEGQFLLNYQPIVEIAGGGLWGAEALIRWQHPERGLVPPDEFIPLAEETGLIVPIGDWILEESLRMLAIWSRRPSRAPFNLTVNLSRRQLSSDGLVGRIARIVQEAAVDPGELVLEITESALADDVDSALETLVALKKLGVRLAIDDFGTGYSSIQYLSQVPADIIKIAKPFVDNIHSPESDDYRVARAIVRLGEAFGLRTLAEGIEDVEQLDRMRELGCELGQGYFFSRPLPAEEIASLLVGEHRAVAA